MITDTDTLTLPAISNKVLRHFERSMMLEKLTQMAIKSLPNSTDSDEPLALLNGMVEIIHADTAETWRLCKRLKAMKKKLKKQTHL